MRKFTDKSITKMIRDAVKITLLGARPATPTATTFPLNITKLKKAAVAAAQS